KGRHVQRKRSDLCLVRPGFWNNKYNLNSSDRRRLFKAQRASCKMTEAEYAEKATQLLDILGDFEGLIAELADAPSQ
ncbi:MAG: hypothetical protein WCC43_04640, partial [Pseudolabrys sp.]